MVSFILKKVILFLIAYVDFHFRLYIVDEKNFERIYLYYASFTNIFGKGFNLGLITKEKIDFCYQLPPPSLMTHRLRKDFIDIRIIIKKAKNKQYQIKFYKCTGNQEDYKIMFFDTLNQCNLTFIRLIKSNFLLSFERMDIIDLEDNKISSYQKDF